MKTQGAAERILGTEVTEAEAAKNVFMDTVAAFIPHGMEMPWLDAEAEYYSSREDAIKALEPPPPPYIKALPNKMSKAAERAEAIADKVLKRDLARACWSRRPLVNLANSKDKSKGKGKGKGKGKFKGKLREQIDSNGRILSTVLSK